MCLSIVPIPVLKDNYVWVIINTKRKCAIVVDPGDAMPVIAFLQEHQLTLSGIFITHHHWDHTNGLSDLIRQYENTPVFGSMNSTIAGLTHHVRETDIVAVEFFNSYQVIEIPGHTSDHIAYYAKGALFCGDTLFAGGCGRLFEGTADQLYASLKKMAILPDDTKIYCAHEYTLSNLQFAQTVEPNNQKIHERTQRIVELRDKNMPSLPSILIEEKETNPFLRCDSPEIIHQVMQHAGRSLHDSVDVFSELRKWKNNF